MSHADRRRPQSPSAPPGRNTAASKSRIDHQTPTVGLIQLRVCAPSPSLGSHIFLLRSGCEVEEIAIRINDTLPSVAELVYPDPAKWKQSWESVCRSLMPHRENIIRDKHRVRSISEFAADRLPHGNQGSWTAAVLRDIFRLQLCLSNSAFSWECLRSAGRTSGRQQIYHCFEPNKKDSQGNHYGIIFSFEPRRRLPNNFRTQSVSPFYWAHNTDSKSAISILKDDELIRPSKWLEDPSPNEEYTNWNDVWIPPMGFYCTGSLRSNDAAAKSAAQFGGVHSSRPLCVGGKSRLRQEHCMVPRGGTHADIAASHYYDCIHSKDGRWKLRSSIAVPSYVGMFW